MADPLLQRFWAKIRVGKPDECWPWTAGTNHFGHGRFRVGSARVLSHRYSWELANGPVPIGQCVLHTCDNPPCCNPKHLFLGTRLDNNKDKTQKGRQARGESLASKLQGVRNGHAKLNDDAAREIRRLARAGVTQEQIANRFGISRAHVSDVASGKKWRHVS